MLNFMLVVYENAVREQLEHFNAFFIKFVAIKTFGIQVHFTNVSTMKGNVSEVVMCSKVAARKKLSIGHLKCICMSCFCCVWGMII